MRLTDIEQLGNQLLTDRNQGNACCLADKLDIEHASPQRLRAHLSGLL
jgi:hypothetical protein